MGLWCLKSLKTLESDSLFIQMTVCFKQIVWLWYILRNVWYLVTSLYDPGIFILVEEMTYPVWQSKYEYARHTKGMVDLREKNTVLSEENLHTPLSQILLASNHVLS